MRLSVLNAILRIVVRKIVFCHLRPTFYLQTEKNDTIIITSSNPRGQFVHPGSHRIWWYCVFFPRLPQWECQWGLSSAKKEPTTYGRNACFLRGLCCLLWDRSRVFFIESRSELMGYFSMLLGRRAVDGFIANHWGQKTQHNRHYSYYFERFFCCFVCQETQIDCNSNVTNKSKLLDE